MQDVNQNLTRIQDDVKKIVDTLRSNKEILTTEDLTDLEALLTQLQKLKKEDALSDAGKLIISKYWAYSIDKLVQIEV